MMEHKYLMQPANSPVEPRILEINLVCVTLHQMLRQDHDESLEYNQEQVLLVSLCSLQLVLQFLYLEIIHKIGSLSSMSLISKSRIFNKEVTIFN